MIQVNELRIGNWVRYKPTHDMDVYGKITGFYNSEDEEIRGVIDYHWPLSIGKPIPLTEEILVKCGFEKRKMNDGFDRYFIGGVTIDLPYFQFDYDNGDYNIEIKSVHQLQNLYFALTGEELITNL